MEKRFADTGELEQAPNGAIADDQPQISPDSWIRER